MHTTPTKCANLEALNFGVRGPVIGWQHLDAIPEGKQFCHKAQS